MDNHLINKEQFTRFVVNDDHPCIMAQSVFSNKNYRLLSYDNFGSQTTAKKILSDINDYLKDYDFSSNNFFSFIAVFEGCSSYSNVEFENLLWQQLQKIHDNDAVSWDKTVSADPTNKSFSFSISGVAFYVIGMHPNSSRNARKSAKPCLVFNLHGQFEKLRKMGVYNRVRDTIRKRDIDKNGSVNPMLKDFGNKSEASQYSGRVVDESWKCPFNHNESK